MSRKAQLITPTGCLVLMIPVFAFALILILKRVFTKLGDTGKAKSQERILRKYHEQLDKNVDFLKKKEQSKSSYNLLTLLKQCGAADAPKALELLMDDNSGKTSAKVQTSLIQVQHPFPKGSTFFFGRYCQSSQAMKDSIEWIVLKSEPDRLFLLSKSGLDVQPYDSQRRKEWEQSDIRKWLNGKFLNEAFSADEQAKMLSVGSDKVLLLSKDELVDLPKEMWLCHGTTYCGKIKPLKYSRNYGHHHGEGEWWLRSNSSYLGVDCMTDYKHTGACVQNSCWFDKDDVLVRPAIWVTI